MDCQWIDVPLQTLGYGCPVDLGTVDGIKDRYRSRILAESIAVAQA